LRYFNRSPLGQRLVLPAIRGSGVHLLHQYGVLFSLPLVAGQKQDEVQMHMPAGAATVSQFESPYRADQSMTRTESAEAARALHVREGFCLLVQLGWEMPVTAVMMRQGHQQDAPTTSNMPSQGSVY
jgi:hypothetical protein